MNQFAQALRNKGIDDKRIKERFRVFCLKYELEALILAAESELANRLEVDSLTVTWKIPVEEQNHDVPPSKVLEKLFTDYGKTYKKTVDAPLILGTIDYQIIIDRCYQSFKPFVKFIEQI